MQAGKGSHPTLCLQELLGSGFVASAGLGRVVSFSSSEGPPVYPPEGPWAGSSPGQHLSPASGDCVALWASHELDDGSVQGYHKVAGTQ